MALTWLGWVGNVIILATFICLPPLVPSPALLSSFTSFLPRTPSSLPSEELQSDSSDTTTHCDSDFNGAAHFSVRGGGNWNMAWWEQDIALGQLEKEQGTQGWEEFRGRVLGAQPHLWPQQASVKGCYTQRNCQQRPFSVPPPHSSKTSIPDHLRISAI